MEFDPTDATFNTLVAGVGRMSSFGSDGGAQTGLLRTTDGGTTWTNLGRGTANTLPADNVRGLAARGSTVAGTTL